MRLGSLLLVLLLVSTPATARRDDKGVSKTLLSSIDGLPFGQLPEQQLPASGCAAYLWSKSTTHALVAMATADPAQVRLSIDGVVVDYPRTAQHGASGFGFDRWTTYRRGDVTAVLDMQIATQSDLTDGAEVTAGTLMLERSGKDVVILPVGGLIGCSAREESER